MQKKEKDSKTVMIPDCWFKQMKINGSSVYLSQYGSLTQTFYIYVKMQERWRTENIALFSVCDFLKFIGCTTKDMFDRRRKEVSDMLIRLQQDDLINAYENTYCNNTIALQAPIRKNDVFYIQLNYTSRNFTVVEFREIERIMNYQDSLICSHDLLPYFCSIIFHINTKTNLAYPPLEKLSEINNISSNTCIKYNQILMDLELIYYESAGTIKLREGIKSYNNTYARYNNKQLVKDYIDKRQVSSVRRSSIQQQSIANHRRSLKQKINHMEKQHKENLLTTEQFYELDKMKKEYDYLSKEHKGNTI